eukprot:COSAG03_NODE_10124_length_670_cov_2.019264_2_plen_133_part_00
MSGAVRRGRGDGFDGTPAHTPYDGTLLPCIVTRTGWEGGRGEARGEGGKGGEGGGEEEAERERGRERGGKSRERQRERDRQRETERETETERLTWDGRQFELRRRRRTARLLKNSALCDPRRNEHSACVMPL